VVGVRGIVEVGGLMAEYIGVWRRLEKLKDQVDVVVKTVEGRGIVVNPPKPKPKPRKTSKPKVASHRTLIYRDFDWRDYGDTSCEGTSTVVTHGLGTTPATIHLAQLSSANIGDIYYTTVNASQLTLHTTVSGSFIHWVVEA